MTEVASRPNLIKLGRGIELSTEALLSMIAERFPNLVDWDELSGYVPAVDYSQQTHTWGAYFAFLERHGVRDGVREDVVGPLRQISQGAPIPTLHLSDASIWLDKAKTVSRCGWFVKANEGWRQCNRPLGHVDEDHIAVCSWINCGRDFDHEGGHGK